MNSAIFTKRENGPGAPKTPVAKRKRHFVIKKTTIFIILMLLYPVVQFCIMWFGVNINSILLTFQDGNSHYYPMSDLFHNYVTVFMDMKTSTWQSIYGASFAYVILNCFITLPISLFFSYFIFKKIYAAGIFKAIFYLPCVLPIVALTLIYTLSFTNAGDAQGFMSILFNSIGVDTSTWFFGDSAKWIVWVFCFWTGIGYDVMLLTAGMSRIPRELLESAKMDGISPMKEFIFVIIPLTWPTITTLFIFAMMGFFGTFLQPMLLTKGQYGTMTIGLKIFYEADTTSKSHAAALGLLCTIIGSPIILGVRSLLNHFFKEVNF